MGVLEGEASVGLALVVALGVGEGLRLHTSALIRWLALSEKTMRLREESNKRPTGPLSTALLPGPPSPPNPTEPVPATVETAPVMVLTKRIRLFRYSVTARTRPDAERATPTGEAN